MVEGQTTRAYISNSDLQAIGHAAGQAAASAISAELSQKLERIKEQLAALNSKQSATISSIDETARKVGINTQTVEGVRRRITDIERAKAEAKRELSRVERIVKDLAAEAKRTKAREEGIIQDDYDRNMEELLKEFVQDTKSTHTGVLDSIRKEFGELDELKEAMLEDTQWFFNIHSFYYDHRQKELKKNKEMVLNTIKDFLEERERIQMRIRQLKCDIPIKQPASFLYPFWVIGIEDSGVEDYIVLPVQNTNPPLGKPTEEEPYIDLLSDHDTFSIIPDDIDQDLWNYILSPGVIDSARLHDILPELEHYKGELSKLADTGYFNRDFIQRFLSYYSSSGAEFQPPKGKYLYSSKDKEDVSWDSSYKDPPPPPSSLVKWTV